MNAPDKDAKAIFAEAMALADPAERRACLHRACGGNSALREEVESLLRAHEQAGDFLRQTIKLTEPDFVIERTGAMIGRYKLLEKIGEGGFGTVYMAEQLQPVQRKVAIKIIKAGMDTREVVARFEAERQALALMDHPNIARVLDAGATEAGRPYFVMELVRGIPITDYCDREQLSTAQRLRLFIKVCHAVQHAHQKGIIHRDLKPNNVLITLHDGEPVPKVIDFGVAKALGQKLTEKTLFTGFQHMIGTPAYMSPEQAELSGLDIDTRADIYSLGVLLYELLTGETPFDTGTWRQAALDEIRRIIRETEPSKPSTRLHTLGDKLAGVAKRRQTEPMALKRLVRGDLDWIVMKALEKDRRRRYETPDAFASDVARHLSNEPVLASPPRVSYLVAKFVRRHKAVLATASALLVLLAAGVVVSTWQAVRATRAERMQSSLRQQAEQAGVNESKQRQRAEQLRATAEDQAGRIGHQLYVSHMNLAFQVWERGDLRRVEQLLDEHRPKPGEEDLRGFEWFYLWRLCHSDQLTLRGHFSNVRGVAWSPDGRLLGTAGDDSTARVWDAQTGKQEFVLRGHRDGVAAIAFAPNGKLIATGSGDQTVRLWDVSTGEESALLLGHNHGISALAFSPDGRRLAAATGRLASGGNTNPADKFIDPAPLAGEVRLWDVEGRKVILTLAGNTGSILALAFSPDGKALATGTTDATVKIWDAVTGTMKSNLAGFKGPVIAVAFSPDGQNLAIGGGDPYRLGTELQLWDLVTGKQRMTLKANDGPVFAVAFAPNGKTLASGGLGQIVRFWDVATGEEVRTIKAHQASIWAIAYDPSGQKIATGSWDQTVKVWGLEHPQGMEIFPNAGGYSGCFSADSRYLIRGGTRLEVIEVGTDKAPFVIPDYQTGDIVMAVAPDGSILASAGTDQIVTLWEMRTWRRLAKLQTHTDKVWQLTFSPDSRTLASSDAAVLRLWDVARRIERVAIRPDTDGIGRLLFTPDGRSLIVSGGRRTVFLDATTGREIKVLNDTTWCSAISPGGEYLLGGSPSGLKLIDLKTMEAQWCINPHRANTWEVNFSPDGRTIATASWDGTAKLWNVTSGQEMFTYKVPAVAWSTTFSPDGQWWVVGSGSGRQSEVALFRRATLAEVDAADSPRILQQPGSQTSTEGRTLTFAVLAAGLPPLSYQWHKGAQSLPGQTNAVLTLSNVTAACAGDYRVVVANALSSTASSNATLQVLQVCEVPIAEVDFQKKQPATYSAFTYCATPVPLKTEVAELPGVGIDGTTGLVMRADGSGFTNHMNQDYAGFGLSVAALANTTNGVNTSNLNLYKLYATVKTAGLTGTNARGRIQGQFLTPTGVILTADLHATFTSNYQEYSFILGDASFDPGSEGSRSDFVANFGQINRVACTVNLHDWLSQYGPDADNSIYIGSFKFVRLVPMPAPLPINPTGQ